ncbi:maltokinase N-terminal cap-like domain-containing protein [Nocardioides nanhaiensis]|uniref:Maltokinase n=1 Tax=Nocardioides nanhaiensis TaxID=1476871 RepID=A0ABP8WQN6_9ACTN
MTDQTPDPTPDQAAVLDYVTGARWFGGKGRETRGATVRRLGAVDTGPDGPPVVVEVVEVTYADGGTEHYQVPLALYTDAETRLDHAFVGWWEDPEHGWVHGYDAVHDRAAMAGWLRGFVAAREGGPGTGGSGEVGGLRFERLPGHELDPETTASVFSGEQSNSSVFFGEDAILKLFRKVTPGPNPDIEIHRALTAAGSEHVAALYGWVEAQAPGSDDGDVLQLGMLQQFLRTASDGFELALASVRNLFAEADLHAHEVGGDFAAESERLGLALREIHTALAAALPAGAAPLPPAELAATMTRRLEQVVPAVPQLAEHEERLRRVFDAVAGLDEVPVQRVHGDLHLGQTLRTALGWKVVDFEGEPAKSLAERILPDSPWRDVAGMLRSFAYAPASVLRSHGEDPQGATQLAFRAAEWTHRNQNHFLHAYAGGELSAADRTLLDAYTADKAVYECLYETRNRPSWVTIPLAAVAEIGATP